MADPDLPATTHHRRMNEFQRANVPSGSNGQEAANQRWAPWWVYVVVIVGANWVRGSIMSDRDLPAAVQVVSALGLAAVLYVAVTVVWRAMNPGGGR